MDASVRFTQELLRCPSLTPDDAGSFDLIESWLKPAGFRIDRLIFEQEGQLPVENLYARLGMKPPFLLFAGHVDVVPTGDISQWRFDPFSGEIADGQIWGRGAADMKGGLAASIAATLSFLQNHSGFAGSIGFLITSDEEGPAVNGTLKLLQWAQQRGEVFDHCVLAEPTNPDHLGEMIKVGRRGSLTGWVVAVGKQGHVAYPERANNPIPKLMLLMQALTARPLDTGNAHFSASNLEFIDVDVGNKASNVIPAEARARFNVRFNNFWTAKTLAREIEQRLMATGLAYRVEFEPSNAEAFVTAPGALSQWLSEAIAKETGCMPELSTTGGTSDARFITQFCPVVEFGLVGKTMHAVNERVDISDLEKLSTIYRRFLARYFQNEPVLYVDCLI